MVMQRKEQDKREGKREGGEGRRTKLESKERDGNVR
jgi:hypothetical protein